MKELANVKNNKKFLKEETYIINGDFNNTTLYLLKSPYAAKNNLLSSNYPKRVFIDETLSIYLVAKAYDTWHEEMVDTASDKAGYDIENVTLNKTIGLLYVPNNEISEIPFDEFQDAVLDAYIYVYEYANFKVYSRDEFEDFKLYKILGECLDRRFLDIKNYKDKLNESFLVEADRRELVNKGKRGASYALNNQALGKNRYERRKHSKIQNQVKNFNDIDMNTFFKKDILTVGIQVRGETNNYVVKIKFSGILEELRKAIKQNNNIFDFRIIMRTLSKVFNSGDVYIRCSCDDWKYRFAYWASKNGYNEGEPQLIPADITNPTDNKGSGCKHSLLVLSNIDWMMKVASVINNYIHYIEDYMPKAFADIIFPALYGVKYDRAIQLSLFEPEDLDSSESIIDIINEYGRTRGQYRKKPAPSINPRFQKVSKEEETGEEPEIQQLSFDLNQEDEEENQE